MGFLVSQTRHAAHACPLARKSCQPASATMLHILHVSRGSSIAPLLQDNDAVKAGLAKYVKKKKLERLDS